MHASDYEEKELMEERTQAARKFEEAHTGGNRGVSVYQQTEVLREYIEVLQSKEMTNESYGASQHFRDSYAGSHTRADV